MDKFFVTWKNLQKHKRKKRKEKRNNFYYVQRNNNTKYINYHHTPQIIYRNVYKIYK